MHRAQPVFNRLCFDKEMERRQDIHRQKLHGINQGSVSRQTIPQFQSSEFKLNHLKKEQMNESRYTEIERENRILLEKITHIMTKGSSQQGQSVQQPYSSSSSTNIQQLNSLNPQQQQQQQQQPQRQFSPATEGQNNAYPDTTQGFLEQMHQQQHQQSIQQHLVPIHGNIGNGRPGSPPKTSLNLSKRRKEENRVQDENSQILKRLQAKKSHYSVRKWENDFQKNISRATNISQFPFSIFPPQSNNNSSLIPSANLLPPAAVPVPNFSDLQQMLQGNSSVQSSNRIASPLKQSAPQLSMYRNSFSSHGRPTSQAAQNPNQNLSMLRNIAAAAAAAPKNEEDPFYYSATGNAIRYLKKQHRHNPTTRRQNSMPIAIPNGAAFSQQNSNNNTNFPRTIGSRELHSSPKNNNHNNNHNNNNKMRNTSSSRLQNLHEMSTIRNVSSSLGNGGSNSNSNVGGRTTSGKRKNKLATISNEPQQQQQQSSSLGKVKKQIKAAAAAEQRGRNESIEKSPDQAVGRKRVQSQQQPKKSKGSKHLKHVAPLEQGARTVADLFPMTASTVVLFHESRMISGLVFDLQIREEDGGSILILAEQVESGELKVIEIPKQEAIAFLRDECDGDPRSLALRLRLHEGKLYLIGTRVPSPTRPVPVAAVATSLQESHLYQKQQQQQLENASIQFQQQQQQQQISPERQKGNQNVHENNVDLNSPELNSTAKTTQRFVERNTSGMPSQNTSGSGAGRGENQDLIVQQQQLKQQQHMQQTAIQSEFSPPAHMKNSQGNGDLSPPKKSNLIPHNRESTLRASVSYEEVVGGGAGGSTGKKQNSIQR